MTHLACVAASADELAVDRIRRLLAVEHIALGPSSTLAPGDGSPRVVAFLSQVAVADATLRATVERLGSDPTIELLPVALDQGGTTLLRSVSHLDHRALGADRTAQRIAVVATAGSADLAAWNRLTGRAQQWVAGGRPTSARLSAEDADAAEALLVRPIGRTASEERVAVEDLVGFSRRSERRRRVARIALVTAVVAVLAVAATSAAGQSRTARQEASRADRAADRSRAGRLLDQAEAQAPFDPDLPWLLAREALDDDPSSTVAARAAALVSRLVPHTTTDLPFAPGPMATAGPHAAILSLGTDRIAVVDVDTGALVVDITAEGDRFDGFALSPDGARLAVLDEGLRIVEVATGEAGPVLHGRADGVQWPSVDRVLLQDGDEIVAVDPDGAPDTRLATVDGARFLDATPDDWIAVAIGGGVTVLGPDGEEQATIDEPDVTGITASPDDEELLVWTSFGFRRVPLTRTGAVDEDREERTVRVTERSLRWVAQAPGAEGVLPICLSDGMIGAVHPGTSTVVDGFVAHRGTCLAVAALSDERWVSVGTDRRLRTWDTSGRAETFIDGQAVSIEISALLTGSGDAETLRAQIVAAPGSERATATATPAFAVAIVDRRTGRVARSASIGGIDAPVRPAATVGRGVRFYPNAPSTWDVEARASVDLPPAPLSPSERSMVVSPDGRTVAVVGEAATYVVSADDVDAGWREEPYDQVDRPVAARVDDAGRATVLFANGALWRSGDGSSTRLVDGAERLEVGRISPDGTIVAVAADARVLVGDDTGLAPRGEVARDVRPYAVDVSADGTHAAVIGLRRTQVVRLDEGTIVAEDIVDEDYRPITAMLFDDDDPAGGGVAVRADGSVRRWDLVRPADVGAALRDGAPRRLTDEERASAGVEG